MRSSDCDSDGALMLGMSIIICLDNYADDHADHIDAKD